jgi:hypothetical protein
MNVKRIFLGALVATGAWLAFTTTASAQTAAAPTTGAADKEQHRISDQDLTLDKFGLLTDEQARMLMRQWMEVDISAAQLRAKYLPIVSQAIGGKKGATFAQLDRRVSLMIELQLASQVPLVQAQ